MFAYHLNKGACLWGLSALLLTATSAQAADNINSTMNKRLADDTYVTLSGTVGKITDQDEFYINYGGGSLKVDTNDKWPNLFSAGAASVLKPGDRVRISGQVDDNLFTGKEIDATSISHEGTNYSRVYWTGNQYVWPNYYYDSENSQKLTDDSWIGLTGTVAEIVSNDEFLLNYENGSIQVETEGMDFANSQRLRVGDRVTVYGTIDDDWLEKKELEADRIYHTAMYYR